MGWDSNRPVPWTRLVREWLIYAAIMTAIFAVFFRDDNVIGAVAGVLISGPLYLGFGAVMAKFGYNRTRLKDIRSAAKESPSSAGPDEKRSRSQRSGDTGDESRPRTKPAPTRRTAGGGNRPRSSTRRKR